MDQVADSIWDGPAQLVVIQMSLIKSQPSQTLVGPGSRKQQNGWDCSLQHSQVDQIADSFWDGPAQLILIQASIFKAQQVRLSTFGQHKTMGLLLTTQSD
jgi:hypothetical protein